MEKNRSRLEICNKSPIEKKKERENKYGEGGGKWLEREENPPSDQPRRGDGGKEGGPDCAKQRRSIEGTVTARATHSLREREEMSARETT